MAPNSGARRTGSGGNGIRKLIEKRRKDAVQARAQRVAQSIKTMTVPSSSVNHIPKNTVASTTSVNTPSPKPASVPVRTREETPVRTRENLSANKTAREMPPAKRKGSVDRREAPANESLSSVLTELFGFDRSR